MRIALVLIPSPSQEKANKTKGYVVFAIVCLVSLNLNQRS